MTEAATDISADARVAYRLANDTDLGFVYRSMLRALYGDSDAKSIPSNAFFVGHSKKLDACLKRPTSKLVIACLSDDPATILGFLLADGRTVHFVYCKAHFRRLGVAKGLFQALGLSLEDVTVSHLTNQARRIFVEKGITPTYDPYRF